MANYITYGDLKKAVIDTGRPYDLDMLDRAFALRTNPGAPNPDNTASRINFWKQKLGQ